MQDCPIPKLGTTLAEINRALSFILEPGQYETYTNALTALTSRSDGPFQEVVERVNGHFVSLDSNDDFKTLLLSQRPPLFQTLLMTALLSPLVPNGDQLDAASELLARLAIVCTDRHKHLSTAPNGSDLERDQAESIFSTVRLPGEDTDTLETSHDSRHVVVWADGHAFSVEILDGSRSPKTAKAIKQSLEGLVGTSTTIQGPEHPISSLSWNLSRPQWSEVRQLILAQEHNARSLAAIESAITTVALEPFTPQVGSEMLENLRSGQGSVNRYADHTLGFVVYQDGTTAFTADHTPVDGSIIMQLATALALCKTSSGSDSLNEPAQLHHLPFTLSHPLSLAPSPFSDGLRVVRTTSLGVSIPIDIMDKLRQSRLVHFIVHMSVQSALRLVRESLPENPLIVQPVSVRHFAHGRAHPSYPVTSASIALIDALHDSSFDISDEGRRRELCVLFGDALVTHRALVKAVKCGAAVGPHLATLSMALSADEQAVLLPETQQVLDAWSRFSGMNGPIVSVTGFTDATGVEAMMTNIYGPHQLVGCYTGHKVRRFVALPQWVWCLCGPRYCR